MEQATAIPATRSVADEQQSQGRERMSDAPGLCPVCGSQSFILEESVTDPWFGYPGAWRYDRCSSKKCGIAHIANPLTPEKLAEAYGNYYTHSASPPDKIEVALGRWIDRRNRRHGDKFPSLPFLFREAEYRILLSGAVPSSKQKVALDVGCGSGERLDYLSKIGWGTALGVDPDPIAVANGKRAGRQLLLGSAENIPMDDNSVDIIFLHHVVEHLWEIRPALTEAKRVLRQGGHVVIATPNLDSANRRKWGRWWRGYEAPRHLRLYTLSAMQDVLRDTGFGIHLARCSARAAPAWDRESARASGTDNSSKLFGWWQEDRKVLRGNASLLAGNHDGDELLVVGKVI